MNRRSCLDDQFVNFAAKADCDEGLGYLEFPSDSAVSRVRQRVLQHVVLESARFSGALAFFFLHFR